MHRWPYNGPLLFLFRTTRLPYFSEQFFRVSFYAIRFDAKWLKVRESDEYSLLFIHFPTSCISVIPFMIFFHQGFSTQFTILVQGPNRRSSRRWQPFFAASPFVRVVENWFRIHISSELSVDKLNCDLFQETVLEVENQNFNKRVKM